MDALSRVEQQLGLTEAQTNSHDRKTRYLHDKLMGDIRKVRQMSMLYDADPLLICVLYSFSGREISDEFWREAYRSLASDFDSYQVLLVDMIPERLIRSVLRDRQRRAFDEGTSDSLSGDWAEALRRLASMESTGGFPTGIQSVDRALGGGIHGLTFVVAEKGSGKTSLMLNVVRATLEAGDTAVLYYSFDLTKLRVMGRLISCFSRQAIEAVRHLASHNQQQLGNTFPEALREKIAIHERDTSWHPDQEGEFVRQGLESYSIQKQICDLLRATSLRRVLVVIDPFQKIVCSGQVSPAEADPWRLEQIGEVQQRMTRQLGEANVAFLVASEMRKREASRRYEPPTIDDLKGDGRLASDADCVLTLHCTRTIDNDTNEVSLGIVKGREGVTRGDHLLRFDHRIERFQSSGDALPASSASNPINDASALEE